MEGNSISCNLCTFLNPEDGINCIMCTEPLMKRCGNAQCRQFNDPQNRICVFCGWNPITEMIQRYNNIYGPIPIEEGPAPADDENPAPVPEEGPAPVPEEGPEPADDENPAPVPEEGPEPADEENPAHIDDENPASVLEEGPEPADDENPVPVPIEEGPEPADDENPAPVPIEEGPEPADEEGPNEDQAPVPVQPPCNCWSCYVRNSGMTLDDINETYKHRFKNNQKEPTLQHQNELYEVEDYLIRYYGPDHVTTLQVAAVQEMTFGEEPVETDDSEEPDMRKLKSLCECKDQSGECIVCYDCEDDESEKETMPCCGANVHNGCIHKWVFEYNKNTCPACMSVDLFETPETIVKDVLEDIINQVLEIAV